MIILTEVGKENVKSFIRECKQKRKDILDAKIDTCDDTFLPNEEDIISDIEEWIDEDGEYYNGWGVTDNYDSDRLLNLTKDIDFIMK